MLLSLISLLFQMILFLQGLYFNPVGVSVGGMFLVTKESAMTVSFFQSHQYHQSPLPSNHLLPPPGRTPTEPSFPSLTISIRTQTFKNKFNTSNEMEHFQIFAAHIMNTKAYK